jgi:D-alanyl-D-alanine carboxypeptidase
MQESKKNCLLLVVVVILAVEAGLFWHGNFKIQQQIKLEEQNEQKIQTALGNIPVLAKAVSVYDVTQNKKIYGANDDVAMPIASLAKTMTVLVTLNNHKLNDIVSIPMDAITQDGDYGLLKGEKWYMSDLAKATLIASANDGAFALTAEDPNFITEMNERAQRMGMNDTSFSNPTGLDIDATTPGGTISASDANVMAIFALKEFPQIFWVTIVPDLKIASLSGFTHDFKNTDTAVGNIPNLLFSKTGFTTLAGGNLTTIFKNQKGEEYAVTVLGSTFDGRFTDMESIVNALYGM